MHLTLRACAFVISAVFAIAAVAMHDAGAEEAKKEGKDVAIEAIDAFIAETNIDKSAGNWKTRLPKPPQVSFDASKTYYWLLDTNVGNVKIKLRPDVAPMHVSSTIYLTQLGFYDARGVPPRDSRGSWPRAAAPSAVAPAAPATSTTASSIPA